MFRSSGTGWRMISLKKPSLSSILLSHSVLLVRLALVPPKFCAAGDQRVYGGLPVLILIDQRET